MPVYPDKRIPIPAVSIPSYVFGAHHDVALSNLPILLDAARPHDRFLSLASYRRWSQCLASGLLRSGLQAGDKVVLVSGNSIAFPIVLMGVVMAGGVFSGFNPNLPASQLLAQAQEIAPAFLLAAEDAMAKCAEAAQGIGLSPERMFLFERENLFGNTAPSVSQHCRRHWHELLDPAGASFDWSPCIPSVEQLAVINYTSGSTGNPKGVMVSHRNLVANAFDYIEQQRDDSWGPEQTGSACRVSWPPMFQVAGQTQFCMIYPKRGMINYMMDKLELEPLLMYTAKYQAASIFLPPPLLIRMLSDPVARKYDLGCIKEVISGGAPLRKSVCDRFAASMPNPECSVVCGWGMTEVTCACINMPPDERSKTVSVGKLLPNVEAKLMSIDGTKEFDEPFRPGELWVRGPNVTLGYWKRPDLTAQVYMPDGWLRTGDLAFYDENLLWYVVDRIQDIMTVPGLPDTYILPTDLESVLLHVPGVLDAGVTAVAVPVPALSSSRKHNDNDSVAASASAGGDIKSTTSTRRVPRGFVVLDGSSATLEGVDRVYNAKVEPHQRLFGGLFTLDEIPRLPNGKVHRTALSQLKV